ncbi:MAG: DNA replication/repair protein RecF [Veillonellales bacterium]
MQVKKLVLHNYRNYIDLTLNFSHHINIFIGPNAQGKTNILEAIYFGAMGRSHRTNLEGELIRWNQAAGGIQIEFSRLDIANHLAFKLIQNQNKEILLNSHPVKSRDLIGAFNAVLFSPEDLLLIKGIPAGRRKFLDTEISQASPAYYHQLLQYNRILSQRNHLLKKIREHKAKPELLDTWDEQFAAAAGWIVDKRRLAVKKLSMLANLMHRKITNHQENLAVTYLVQGVDQSPADDMIAWYCHQLPILREHDIFRGSTGVGPHRDDLQLTVNGINLRNFGSQGQQRTGVLALKLAELEFIKSETGEYPVLLLDDVMSELDSMRREHLLSFIRERVQTFITATETKYFPEKQTGRYYQVLQGKVTESDRSGHCV